VDLAVLAVQEDINQMSTVLERIQELTSIVTNAIEDGDDSRIPARFTPANLIKVTTGRYREVLPIIVPEHTCILGDELRSTNIGPDSGTTHETDATYSIGALSHMENIVGDIVLGDNITSTSGNIQTQSRDFPFADTFEVNALRRLVRTIQTKIDTGLGTNALVNTTDPIGYNTSYLVGYGDARKLIRENKKFFQEQVIGFIADNYSSVKYSRTKCRRDVRLIVDAVVYDLTYGGISQSLNAGLAYFEGPGSELQIGSTTKAATVAAYNYLRQIMQSVIDNNAVTTNQDIITQFRDTAGSAAAKSAVGSMINVIINIIDNGLNARPNSIIQTITGSQTIRTVDDHNLQVGDVVISRSTSNGLVKNERYWVVSAPASDQLTISESFGGSTKSLTNGTGLSVIIDKVDYPAATNGVSTTTPLITAAETLSAAKSTIIENVIDDLNEIAYHTDFIVNETGLTNDDFVIYVGKNDIVHTYVEGGVVTKSDDTTLNVSNFVYNNTTGYATVTTSSDHNLEAGDEVDIQNITVECTSAGYSQVFTYPSATSTTGNRTKVLYDQSKCLRDIGLILEAVQFDFMFNANSQTYKAALAYLRGSASEVYTLDQKQVTRDALENTKNEAKSNVGGDVLAQGRIESLMTLLDDVIFTGSMEGDNCATDIRNRDYAVLQLERNRQYIVEEIDAYIANTYSDTATATTASTDVVTISDTSWLKRNAAIRFSGALIGGISSDTTYYVQNIVSATEFTIAETRNATSALGLTDGSGSMAVALYYNSDLCKRDTSTYIDALKYDLKYAGRDGNYSRSYIEDATGNYKSVMAGRYYINSVLGSLEEDQYYLRDATGIRNQTVEGLTGDLLAPNELGTSRVTAGAYCSLDPGWGPDDYRGWIITRSPYVQNVTTLGYAATGQKIDGALHNGGNDSIVSNDFTQVISDGIGAHILNNGRAELVSVFSYYAHIAYLAETGGRIRATNGNNSYGDFGSVAEGFDDREVPGTAIVDNKFQFEAVIGSGFTDGNEFQLLEYDNAGVDYTEVSYVFTGGGNNAASEKAETRDDAVFEVRLLDLGDDSSGQFGGEGYLTNSNTAQAGSLTSITLAATDGQLDNDYPGMKVVITGGAGAGQFGIIKAGYNAGTKIANVQRESDGQDGWDHFITGTTIVAPDASSTYTVEPALQFTSPGFTATDLSLPSSGTWTDVVYGGLTGEFLEVSGSYDGSGLDATFDIVKNGSKYIVTINNAGTGYQRLETITIPGTVLDGLTPDNDITITISAVNSVSGAILEFDFDGFGAGGVFAAVRSGSTAAAYSDDGVAWTSSSMPSSSNWSSVTYGLIDDGTSDLLVGRFVAVASGSTAAAFSDDGENWTATTLPASASWSSVEFGDGRFVAVASDSATVAISNDGVVWDVTGTLNSTGFLDVVYGGVKWHAVKPGNSNAYSQSDAGGETWTDDNMPANSTWTSIAYGNNTLIAVASDSNTGAISPDRGTTWNTVTIGSPDSVDPAGLQKIRYGQGIWMATAFLASVDGDTPNQYTYVAKSEWGTYWEWEALPGGTNSGSTHGGFNALAFGNPQRTGRWLVLENASGDRSVSIRTGATTRARSFVAEEKIFAIRITEPGSGYDSAPTLTIVDPQNIFDLPTQVRIGDGVLAQPNFTNRGNGYVTGNAEVDIGDGFGNFFQTGGFIAVRRLSDRPVAGSNVVFDHLPDRTFKLVNVITFLGENDGAYTAFLQVSPTIEISESPDNGVGVTTRLRYSQCRLTGHDFLDIGTGNFDETNYPGTPDNDPIPANETRQRNGGRVFYTSTDQDGNFRVGDLFSIEQSTGVATLNADAFNISGLQELNLGNVTLGGGSATITEFSTDPFFTADSDNIVPTQRAIKAYIAAQIGGGGASLNVNSVTAGSIFISGNEISHVTNGTINMNATFEFRGGVTGLPIAFNYFLN